MTYWTYSTIHRILTNEIYIGNMVQGKYMRRTHNSKPKKLPTNQWIIVENTHESIISRELWGKTQLLVGKNARGLDFNSNINNFAGVIVCGDCKRAMSKTASGGTVYFKCGSYKRYGKSICTAHSIKQSVLEKIILSDINKIIKKVKNIDALYQKNKKAEPNNKKIIKSEILKIEAEIEKTKELRKHLYEDYKEDILTKSEYLDYKKKYEDKEIVLGEKVDLLTLEVQKTTEDILSNRWVKHLLELGQIQTLDRNTILEFVDKIFIYEENKIEIHYKFNDDLNVLMENEQIDSSAI